MVLFYILTAIVIVSLISLVGIITFIFSKRSIDKAKPILISFAAGVFIGTSFFDLLPEAFKYGTEILKYTVLGVIGFFILEKILYWRHCHNGKCDVHIFTYTNLFGDALHNFIDGIIISAGFMANIPLGIATTLAVIFHEIPQELSDFSILVYGGFSKAKALSYNFLVSLSSVIGALFGFLLTTNTKEFTPILIAFAAGGFIYIATSDLIPEMHKETSIKKSLFQLVVFIGGVLLMWLL